MSCSMIIELKKEVSGTESKTDIAASLKMSYDSLAYSVKGSASMSLNKENKKSSEKVTVTVKY